MIKQILVTAIVLAGEVAASASAVSFEGTMGAALRYEVPASAGLEGVYVLNGTDGVRAFWQSPAGASAVRCYRFSNLGGAYAEEIPLVTSDGDNIAFNLSSGDMGYMIETAGTRTCIWVIDYRLHRLDLKSLRRSPEQDCQSLNLDFEGTADEIPYYSINGRRMTLSRDMTLAYSTLIFDDDTFSYRQDMVEEAVAGINTSLTVAAPLCETSYTLTGDRFLKAWGEEVSISSEHCEALAVEAHTRATQSMREVDNEQSSGVEGLGGSAPCEIEFEAAVSDAAIFKQWQISRTPEFDILENTYSELQFIYTFTEQGTTYVRFTADNAAGTCPFESETYEVFIGESKLDIPNAFSPQGSPGINDLWKVSYKSLVSYECHIFNRWGKELFSSSDPSEGWDGRSGGKYVGAGVYFYVIKARGADGVNYERAGDINIINYSDNRAETTE